MEGNFKIWCKTKEIKKEVLNKLGEMGIKWWSGESVSGKCSDYLINRHFEPIGLIVKNKYLLWTNSEYNFNFSDENVKIKKIVPDDFLRDKSITIFAKGRKVIARDEITGKTAIAKCSPEDEFDFCKGARLALNRLLSKVTFKALAVESLGNLLTKGKVYEFIDGRTFWDDGMSSCVYTSFSDFIDKNGSYKKKLVEVKENDDIKELLKKTFSSFGT